MQEVKATQGVKATQESTWSEYFKETEEAKKEKEILLKAKNELENRRRLVDEAKEQAIKEINLLEQENNLEELYIERTLELRELDKKRVEIMKAREELLNNKIDFVNASMLDISRLKQTNPVLYEKKLIELQNKVKH